MSEIIFIHIPKTGGTTINSAMNETYWQTKPGYNYRHILSDKSSNSGDIFLKKNKKKYQNDKIFMMLRHPVDRLISEFYFINGAIYLVKTDFLLLKKKLIVEDETALYTIAPKNGLDIDDPLDLERAEFYLTKNSLN